MKKILLIEDNIEIRENTSEILELDGYEVLTAENGKVGVDIAIRELPDLIICDIMMPVLDGYGVLHLLSKQEKTASIPFIFLTAKAERTDFRKGMDMGADDYITKPFDDDILKAKVETLLRNRSQLKNYFLDSITLNPHTQKVPTETADFLKKCIEVIEKNLANQQFNIKQFSIEMGMSHTRLYTKIKEISGQTLNGFIRSVRLRRAAVLLLTEDIRISHAASQVGMEDVKHFREQFVKLYGMTPSEFIKKYRNSFNSELNIIQKL